MPRAVIGGLGIVACSLGAVVASHLLDPQTAVLEVTQPVAAGQQITNDDLRSVTVTLGSGIDAVPASQAADVVGRPAALPLTPGALLGRSSVGPSAFPPAGQAVTAVALKPGSYPLHLAAGDRVEVVVPSSGTQPATSQQSKQAPAQLVATVTAVGRTDSEGVVVANLLLDQDGAAQVAQAASSISGVAVTLLPAGT